MKYKFLEIGTCDFNSPSQEVILNNEYGICVEPIKYYLDRLPNLKNIYKKNCAISNFRGNIDVYYINEENINKYNLPNWIRGCNKIGDYHPTVLKELKNRNLDTNIICIEKVEVMTFSDLIIEFNCKDIDYLKIDTEGHDHTIIEDMFYFYLNNKTYNLPKKINYETFSNVLAPEIEIKKSKNYLLTLGYKIEKETGSDVYMYLEDDK
jgi:FkbM family methyltransferase